MSLTLQQLRNHALASSLFAPTTLGRAITRLGFVQADPIRAPARAQDLILRHRVNDYRAGDLERSYRALKLEEDFLYAYGFMPAATYRLLHPRKADALTPTQQQVLDIVSGSHRSHPLHPRELEAHLGKAREVNAWGGYSQSTTRALERLHYFGLLRVAGREKGVRLYAPAKLPPKSQEPFAEPERLRLLALRITRILAPLSETTLRATLRHLRHAIPGLHIPKYLTATMLRAGDLRSAEVDGIRYCWTGRLLSQPVEETVRFLAPFDPIVWDRRRFEHFWGWRYRFEAYTPQPQRKLGYYALPLLWKADVVGWVNVSGRGDALSIAPGFVAGRSPSGPAFRRAFRAESERLRVFLAGRPE